LDDDNKKDDGKASISPTQTEAGKPGLRLNIKPGKGQVHVYNIHITGDVNANAI
jgi:hypothetical protein